jgi:hypothetical protein
MVLASASPCLCDLGASGIPDVLTHSLCYDGGLDITRTSTKRFSLSTTYMRFELEPSTPNRINKETRAGSNESDPVGSEKKKQIDTNHTQEGIRHGRKPARQGRRGAEYGTCNHKQEQNGVEYAE